MSDACSCCGADPSAALLAVCDVLVVKALDQMGSRILRADRSRFGEWGVSRRYLVHTRWQPDDLTVTQALKGAWDVIPALLATHGCCGVDDLVVATVLDQYVHDLAITGTAHSIQELAICFESRLGLIVAVPLPTTHQEASRA